MNIALTHKLEFDSSTPPTLQELQALINAAKQAGFADDAAVHIRAADDQRDGYYFKATVLANGAQS